MSKILSNARFESEGRAIAFLAIAMALAFGMSFGIALGMPVLPVEVHQALAAAPPLPASFVAIQLAGCAYVY